MPAASRVPSRRPGAFLIAVLTIAAALRAPDTRAANESWLRVAPHPSVAPPAAGHAAVYDPVRDRMLAFGVNATAEVWSMSFANPVVWTRLTVTGAPPAPRAGATMVYDATADRLVVFGGQLGSFAHPLGLSNEVWSLSLAGTPTWTPLAPGGVAPSARSSGVAVFDPVRDRMLMFGGTPGDSEVYALSLGATPEWSRIEVAPAPKPSTRWDASAIYDPARDQLVVFGGRTPDAGSSAQTWILPLDSLAARQWAEVDAPNPRRMHSAIYEPTNGGRMLVYGGRPSYDSPDVVYADVIGFTLATRTWNTIGTASPPVGRAWHSGIFDPVRNRMVVYGGSHSQAFAECLALALTPGTGTWARLSPPAIPKHPAYRSWQATAYDPVRHRLLLSDGLVPGFTMTSELWATLPGDTATWSRLSAPLPPPFGPAPRYAHVMVVDPVRDRVIVIGGPASWNGSVPADAWAYSFASGTWTDLAPSGTPPSARGDATAVYDPVRDRIVLYGGNEDDTNYGHTMGDAWALALSPAPAWSALAPLGPTPPTRYHHAAIYDPLRDRMVMFGGSSVTGFSFVPLHDVWELTFAGTPRWREIAAGGDLPPPQTMDAGVHDPARDRLVVFAAEGVNGTQNAVRVLSLADSAWSVIAPPGVTPSARTFVSAAYDPDHDRMAVFGGTGGTGGEQAFADLWFLRFADVTAVEGTATPARLALTGARPNPASGPLAIAFELPDAAPATLEVFDLAGRRREGRDVSALGAGRHVVRFADGARWSPGVYLIRLTRGGRVLTTRAAVVR